VVLHSPLSECATAHGTRSSPSTRRSIGSRLSRIGVHAGSRQNPAQVKASLSNYREAKYVYERQVDAHGHWIGLAMLLIVLGIAFDRIGFSEKWQLVLAIALLAGAALFPFSVLSRPWIMARFPRAECCQLRAHDRGDGPAAWGFALKSTTRLKSLPLQVTMALISTTLLFPSRQRCKALISPR